MNIIETCKWSELFRYSNVEIPDFQRILDRDKVKQIVEYQKNNYMKENKYKYFGVITFCICDDKKYLIDGQHRYFSMKKLYHDYGHDSSCNVEYIQVNNLNEVNQYYEIINKNTPLPDYKFTKEDKTIIERVCIHFQEKYPYIWSKNERSRRPHIYFNSFQESLIFIKNYMNFDPVFSTAEKFIEKIEEKNESYKKLKKDDFKNVNEKMLEKAKEWNFYLGLFVVDLNEDYRFLWAKQIVEYWGNLKIEKTNKNKTAKKSISKALKSKLWNKYIGSKNGEALCIVCHNNKINMMNFECGHIIPESKGGETNEDNLLPICSLCNKSMTTQNMYDFTKYNFQNSYEALKQKKYTIENNNKSIFDLNKYKIF
tara:strand:+ start:248 stop:1354 length:1107 start_codon:yes stop_codon:yes gene_type:complete